MPTLVGFGEVTWWQFLRLGARERGRAPCWWRSWPPACYRTAVLRTGRRVRLRELVPVRDRPGVGFGRSGPRGPAGRRVPGASDDGPRYWGGGARAPALGTVHRRTWGGRSWILRGPRDRVQQRRRGRSRLLPGRARLPGGGRRPRLVDLRPPPGGAGRAPDRRRRRARAVPHVRRPRRRVGRPGGSGCGHLGRRRGAVGLGDDDPAPRGEVASACTQPRHPTAVDTPWSARLDVLGVGAPFPPA